jgi:hypothetical protein
MAWRVFSLMGIVALAGSGFPTGSCAALARGSVKPPAAAPSAAQIKARLRHTIEVGTPGEYFRPLGRPLTIKDGRGTGTLTAVVGGRYPTADGLGQVVFFWHNQVFIGLSANY